jgi:predicted transcriptional regulator of viral defense system
MTYRSTQTARRALHELAASQGGFFTAKQAASVGYGKRHLDYHVRAGNVERVGHGLYRLPTIPRSEHDDLIRLSLWSRNRDDEPQAVMSHETAFGIHGLGELLPSHVHVTVPRSFRKRPPPGCVLHKGALGAGDAEEREGFRVTTPLRTLLDVGAGDSVPQEQLDRIVCQALDQGLVRRPKLVAAMKGHPAEARLSQALRSAR